MSQPLTFAALIDELKHEDPTRRLVAFRRISTIAVSIREERTRHELLPYITDCTDDDDEVLVAIAEELASFPDLVGGPAYVPCLLPPLETLASVDSKLVRDKAVTTLAVIHKVMLRKDLSTHFYPMFQRLAAGDWHNLRTSAVLLAPVIYTRVETAQEEQMVLDAVTALARDDLPLVRRAMAGVFAELTPLLPATRVAQVVLPLARDLAGDDHDCTRQANAAALPPIAAALDAQADVAAVAKIFVDACRDVSWRVRNACACEAASLLEAVLKHGEAPAECRAVAQRFAGLLQDTEPEVRAAAVTALPRIAPLVKDHLLGELFPAAAALTDDRIEFVRAAAAPAVLELTPVLGADATVQHIYPLLRKVLNDDSSDVRLALVGNLKALVGAGNIEQLAGSILPAVARLADDQHWRVRQGVIRVVPLLAVALGPNAWDERLGSLVMAWLGDAVHAIREAAVDVLCSLADKLGPTWAVASILPKVAALRDHPNYLHRMTALSAVSRLGPVLGETYSAQQLVPVAAKLAQDAVPNVRFNAARVLGVLADVVGVQSACTADIIKPALLALVDDVDTDVRYFAKEALSHT